MRIILCLFKQQTAYEIRISDWSSDVCSSDLGEHRADPRRRLRRRQRAVVRQRGRHAGGLWNRARQGGGRRLPRPREVSRAPDRRRVPLHTHRRSEEHTSELQSLMRISYAVFCLKKKIKNSRTQSNTTSQHTHTNEYHIDTTTYSLYY